jgi:endonuclease/exonuclease/phosphatase family metal-dependent hydrolase/lipid-A-disaccharide synthase-like uncharacterized protein
MDSEKKRRIGFLGYILRFVNLIILIALLISYTAQWISPTLFWPIAFLGLSLPLLYIINFLFILHWIFRRRKFIIYPLIVFLIGLPLFGRFFNFGNNTEVMDMSSPFKVLTYNVHVFDQYHTKYGSETYARDGILKYLKDENADIYCFQEFYSRKDKKDMDNLSYFKKELSTPYVYFANYSPKSKYLYNVIFSKKPIEASGNIGNTEDSGEMSGIYADIKMNSTLLRVYSVHLKSFQISSEKDIINMNFDIQSPEDQDKIKESSIRMTRKFKLAFEARSKQIKNLKEHIASSGLPVIVAGDFNDTPSSYAYGQLRLDLEDSFMENGKGFGRTYNGPYPSFRIDYILHDSNLINYKYSKGKVKYSDHFPISAVFSATEISE